MSYSYERCKPQVFRVGDIVEVQVSFIVIPVKGGRRKMLTVLRSLALIKANSKKVSKRKPHQAKQATNMERIRLKPRLKP